MTAIINGFKGKTHTLLGTVTVNPGNTSSLKVFQDIVGKEIILVADGHVASVFPGAAPKLRPLGVLDGVIQEINISRRGSDRVKAFKGLRKIVHNVERQFGQRDSDIYKVNATTLADPVSFGQVVLGTTGQNVAIQQAASIMFENKLSGNWSPTLFDTLGLNTAQINFIWAPLSNLQDPDDATAVTSWSQSITVSVYVSCSDYLLGSKDIALGDWVETDEELSFSGAVNGQKRFITPEGMLQGMLITGLHSGNRPFSYENMKKTYLEFRYLGTILAEGTLAHFAEIDNIKTYLGARMKGSAYLSFLNNSAFDSGLLIGENKQIEVSVTTDPALSYASPVRLVFEYDQIKFNAAKLAEIKA